MRVTALVGFLLVASFSSAARGQSRPQVEAFIPVEPREHERLHYFDNRAHHLLPGTVTIDGEGYFCDPHGRSFADPEEFVAHLRTVHRIPAAEIRGVLVMSGGRIHFPGK